MGKGRDIPLTPSTVCIRLLLLLTVVTSRSRLQSRNYKNLTQHPPSVSDELNREDRSHPPSSYFSTLQCNSTFRTGKNLPISSVVQKVRLLFNQGVQFAMVSIITRWKNIVDGTISLVKN